MNEVTSWKTCKAVKYKNFSWIDFNLIEYKILEFLNFRSICFNGVHILTRLWLWISWVDKLRGSCTYLLCQSNGYALLLNWQNLNSYSTGITPCVILGIMFDIEFLLFISLLNWATVTEIKAGAVPEFYEGRFYGLILKSEECDRREHNLFFGKFLWQNFISDGQPLIPLLFKIGYDHNWTWHIWWSLRLNFWITITYLPVSKFTLHSWFVCFVVCKKVRGNGKLFKSILNLELKDLSSDLNLHVKICKRSIRCSAGVTFFSE